MKHVIIFFATFLFTTFVEASIVTNANSADGKQYSLYVALPTSVFEEDGTVTKDTLLLKIPCQSVADCAKKQTPARIAAARNNFYEYFLKTKRGVHFGYSVGLSRDKTADLPDDILADHLSLTYAYWSVYKNDKPWEISKNRARWFKRELTSSEKYRLDYLLHSFHESIGLYLGVKFVNVGHFSKEWSEIVQFYLEGSESEAAKFAGKDAVLDLLSPSQVTLISIDPKTAEQPDGNMIWIARQLANIFDEVEEVDSQLSHGMQSLALRQEFEKKLEEKRQREHEEWEAWKAEKAQREEELKNPPPPPPEFFEQAPPEGYQPDGFIFERFGVRRFSDGKDRKGRQRVVLVENYHDDVIPRVAGYLERQGFKVLYASDVKEAVQKVSEEAARQNAPIHLSVLAHGLPGKVSPVLLLDGENSNAKQFGAGIRGKVDDLFFFSCSAAGFMDTPNAHALRTISKEASTPTRPVPVGGVDRLIYVKEDGSMFHHGNYILAMPK